MGRAEFTLYTSGNVHLSELLDANHHLRANNKQLHTHVLATDVRATIQTLHQCLLADQDWCTSCGLQLNASKTELASFWLSSQLPKPARVDSSMTFNNTIVQPSSVV